MRTYYRELPNLLVSQENRYVRNYHYAFVWVTNIRHASSDYLPAVKVTQEKLKTEHGWDTALVPIEDPKLMQPKYAIARDVDDNRIKIQTIEGRVGMFTCSDELLTDPEPGVITFDGVFEMLGRNEDEAEDADRK